MFASGLSPRSWGTAGIIAAVIIGLPALIARNSGPKNPFDDAPVRLLEKLRPEVILIGDSMLGTRIDPVVLSGKTGSRIAVLAHPGSGSAYWFLEMKNHIAVARQSPKWVIVFFRGDQLTLPGFRTGEGYRLGLEACQRDSEPVYDQIMGAKNGRRLGWQEIISREVYPVQRFMGQAQSNLQRLALHLVARGSECPEVRKAAQDLFSLKNLRNAGGAAEGEEESLDADGKCPVGRKFTDVVKHSFLPPILEIARQKGIRMLFFRVKRRPPADGEFSPESPEVQQYQRELNAYLENAGAVLVDESRDPGITLSFYNDGDHVAEAMMGRYTELFWRKIGPILDPAPPSTP
jgi:hypothetical protein